MKRFRLLLSGCLLAGALLTSVFNIAAQSAIDTQFANPVLNKDFPDPTIIRSPGANWYAYATQGNYKDKMLNIQVAYSTDMFHWNIVGDALPVKPSWADKTASFWAPHVLYDSSLKKYVLFFSSASNDTSTGKCIGVAFSDSAAGPFVDKGTPLICGEGFVNIDPMAFVDPATNKKLLYWGSGFQPIKVQELTNDWSAFKKESIAKPLVWPGTERAYTILIEGAWLDYEKGKYYLFYSGDNCCGEKAHYAVMVARADSATGPFERMGEHNSTQSSVILEQNDQWLAPGHNSIFMDKMGRKYIAYHAIDKKQPPGKHTGTRRVLLISRLEYKDGWPIVSQSR